MHSNGAAVIYFSMTTQALFTHSYFLFPKHFKKNKRQGIYSYPLSYLSREIQVLKPFMWYIILFKRSGTRIKAYYD